MAKTIAIVGAGPGVGLAVAQRFGSEGYNVALVSRDAKKLDGLVDKLKGEGIEAASFAADVRDRPGLTAALGTAMRHFGTIDVLEYSPTPSGDTLRPPTAIDVENEQLHLDVAILGAITAVRVVLPGMLERKDGGLLFTTAASAQHPVAFTASFGVAAGAALNYARVLYQELKPQGVYAGIVSIAGLVLQPGQEGAGAGFRGMPTMTARDVADVHWNLFTKRDTAEAFAGDIGGLLKMIGH